MPSGTPKNPKTCVACGKEFMPRGGRATRCDECKKRAPRQPSGMRPAESSSHDSQYRPKRASKLSVSKMMEIDASVARRIAAMDEEEEDDEAT